MRPFGRERAQRHVPVRNPLFTNLLCDASGPLTTGVLVTGKWCAAVTAGVQSGIWDLQNANGAIHSDDGR